MFGFIIETLENYIFMLPLLVVIQIVICRYYKKNGVTVSKGFIIGWQVLALLVLAILSVTSSPGINQIGKFGPEMLRSDEINLIPFSRVIGHNKVGLIMNAVMFVPLGILIPLIWKKMLFLRTAIVGFVFSLLIELSQLLNWRATDVDDLIMNTLGCAIGYLIYIVVFRKLTFFQMDTGKKYGMIKNDAMIQILIIFLMRFLIGRPLLGVIWSFMYG